MNDNNCKVSVIVPIYNTANHIETCAKSLFNQTIQDIEYIFVNDATLDDSIEILNRVISQYPNRKDQITIINHSQNKGLSESRSSGIKRAKGEYIIHCDSDDWVDSDMYERMFILAKTCDADIVGCGIILEKPNGYKKLSFQEGYEDNVKDIRKVKIDGIYSSLCNKLIRKSLYSTHCITPYAGLSMWEDNAVTFRLRFFSSKTVVLRECFYHYRMNNESICFQYSIDKKVNEMGECAEKISLFLYENRGICDNYDIISSYIKILSKTYLIDPRYISYTNIKKWSNIFKESHKYILLVPIAKYDKICGKLIILKLYFLALIFSYLTHLKRSYF